MSWLKDLTSKAEALLVKIDQDAAQALQNRENLLSGTRLPKLSADASNPAYRYSASESKEPQSNKNDNHNITNVSNINNDISPGHETPVVIERTSSSQQEPRDDDLQTSANQSVNLTQSDKITISDNSSAENKETLSRSDDVKNENLSQSNSNNARMVNESQQTKSQYSKKFTIQTSRAQPFVLDKRSSRGAKSELSNNERARMNGRASKLDSTITSPGADDIRASINKSLQEYTIQNHSTPYNVPRDESKGSQPSAYQSHFDNQPNLIQHSPLLETGYNEKPSSSRLHSSPSFSIDVPDDSADSSSSNSVPKEITMRLLRQSVSKRKTTFYLHKVINSLANSNGQANTMLGNQMRIKFRRFQLRAGSYARRLNYYFRAYPMMKYLIVGYLVIMQILVIYVLFFYQSSSSASELSSQIRQQQQELTESQVSSENNPVNNNLKAPGSS